MDTKDIVVFFVLLLCYSLILIKCVGNELSKVARELADTQNELLRKLPEELLVKGQLKRNVRQADEDTDSPLAAEIRNALTEINEMKLLLADYMNCSTNENNHTKCTLQPGPKGQPGDTGLQGIAGPAGPPGSQGVAGPVGSKGDTGLQGPEGPAGEKGTKGEPGSMGQKGNPGDKGIKGNVGYTGFKGEKGKEGVGGPPGPSGPQGLTGVQGKDGSKGEQGTVGAKGDMGERGLKGDIGPPGPQGETGEKGDMGQKGEGGAKGMKGIQGYTGFKGEKGQKGAGSPGVAGPLGPLSSPTAASTTAPAPIQCTAPEQCGGPGWRSVAFFDLTNTSHLCPPGLKLTSYSRRTCGRTNSSWFSCSSTTFSVGGSQYSRVCGRALAYQFGWNFGFYGYHLDRYGIDRQYVDGLSLTHGAPGSRQHIWTFASGLFTGCGGGIYRERRCPCDNEYSRRSPPFVGSDYFCESTRTECNWHADDRFRLYPDAQLWDGQVCEGGGTCCQLNNPPWFTKNLPIPTNDSIELRLCMLDQGTTSDIALELLELYVQ